MVKSAIIFFSSIQRHFEEYCTCTLVLHVLIVLVDSCSVLQSKKMEKLLAALNLPQVGEIRLVDVDDDSYEEENDGSLFTIELNDRVYTMKVSENNPCYGQTTYCCNRVSAFEVVNGAAFVQASLVFVQLRRL